MDTLSAQDLSQVQAAFTQELATATDREVLRAKYLGKNGILKQISGTFPQLDAHERKLAGRALNELKTAIEDQLVATQEDAWTDVTLPAQERPTGHLHPMSQAIRDISRIFERIGFSRARYPEVDWDHYAFEALNMPKDHPARDEWETFFVDAPMHAERGKMVLTPHTSNGQVREMERLGKPPIRMINIGRCYRRQQDVTHTQMFHQFEGLVVDEGITIGHLKGTFDYFVREFFGPGKVTRLRPFHFQFTEPSFEVDMTCVLCNGTGEIEGAKCRFCKSGWHELGGAGMVHPNVLRAGGIDPERYTGFAFGWGIERTYTLQKGLHLDDIRPLYNGDFAFLRQF